VNNSRKEADGAVNQFSLDLYLGTRAPRLRNPKFVGLARCARYLYFPAFRDFGGAEKPILHVYGRRNVIVM
jgi:hypothetical protein